MGGIEGAIHAAKALVDQYRLKKDWGFLLVDAQNAFNEGNRMAMLWTVQHEWPSGAQFAFNCYQHWGTLVCRGLVEALILYSKKRETQGDPLAMVIYGLGLLLLIRELARRVTGPRHFWFMDDAGVGTKLTVIGEFWTHLCELGPRFGYYP